MVKVNIPRKLKKAAKRIVKVQTLPRLHVNEESTKITAIMEWADCYKLKSGTHNKWTLKVISAIRREQEKLFKREIEERFMTF